jgi:hypothetical protein
MSQTQTCRWLLIIVFSVVAATAIDAFNQQASAQFSNKEKTIKLDGQDFSFTVTATPDGKDFGYFLKSSRWPASSDRTTTVYVCWENFTPEYEKEYTLVQTAIKSTWQDNSKLNFVGWQPCADRSSGVRIFISDEGPHTIGLGKDLDGKSRGMVLNFSFKNWSQSCDSSPEKREYCIKGIAVHEFGHAIGFAHEQNRPDKPGECQEPAQGPSAGSTMLTPYDPSSVMNYCNEKYNNDGMLSKLDLISLQMIYGAK